MHFSVITPTFNRVHILERTYRSLCAQTFRDFEWIVVDDGSTDGTQELVRSWQQEELIRISYFGLPNSGMHVALNVGTQCARGQFVCQLDSDDYCVPHALERFHQLWYELPNAGRYAQIVALCCREDGSILGTPMSADYVDTFELRDALALVDADRWGMVRADVAKAFPYPQFKGEKYIAPGIVHNRMLRKYASRYVADVLKFVCHGPDRMFGNDLRYSSPKGAALYHAELAMHPVPLGMRIRSAINAVRFAAIAAFH